ncbi:restriction endonuclease subunit S [uncultured Psychrobacter sp.]|uniref:restriction endonuclease subunit S n=1 Tax=uncultured Psychrobacter sp. TaxID=259303 RepID=UPI0025935A41|nr:restriction endonuclease subunit S [uncultured Psychrobacter sp.]
MVPSFLKEIDIENWLIKPLKYLISQKYIVGHLDGNHGSLYPRSNEFIDSGVKYISANALINGRVDFEKSKYLSAERASKFKKGVAKSGDVLFAHNATVGPVAILDSEEDYVILGTSLTYYRCNLEKVNNHYLMHFMSSPSFIRQYERIMKQTTRSQIPITAQRDFYFVLPPLPEQQKIAKILTTWDNAISTTERLIDNSKQQKKALMQQLLTGKKRLLDDNGKRFEGEWEKIKLKECAISLDNKRVPLNSTERQSMQGNIPYWGANGIQGYIDKYIFDEPIVLLAEDGGNFSEFSTRPIANISYGKAWVNNHAHVLKAKSNTITEWLYYSLVHKNILAFVNGGTRAKLNKGDMLLIPILLPPLEEQQKIAAVLTNADKEINLLEQQLTDLQQEKKALMQVLLTGKKRVVVDGGTA